ncbi:MAG: protein kinase [Acidobacteriota bacterium]
MAVIDFDKIGKYKVTQKLGQGSFGVVYKGRDAYLKRDVAIKICSVEDEGLRKRFFREAEISGKLVHKNIVTVYEFGFEGQIPYLVQEILSGEDLSRIVKRRAPLAPVAKLDYLLQVASGLGYAHGEGVIHRDIKPGNIRVLEDDRVKIMDFGIAKLASAETQLTQKGVTMGTASYLPPEQIRGSDLDHRADIFSFGVLAYELLTYERPFRGNTLSALVYQILYKVPQAMVDVWPECPAPLSQLIAKCLEKKPDRRFASFAELVPELAAVRQQAIDGAWPGLDMAPAPAVGTATEVIPREKPAEPSDVLSPTAISQTARGVLEGKVGEYTISTSAIAEDVLRPPKSSQGGRSTQPISAQPQAEAPATASGRPAADASATTGTVPTARLPTAEPPAPGESALKTQIMPAMTEPGDETGSDLTLSAQEISKLVAQGNLNEAKEQLEATINRLDATRVDEPAPSSEGEPAPPSAATAAATTAAATKTATPTSAAAASVPAEAAVSGLPRPETPAPNATADRTPAPIQPPAATPPAAPPATSPTHPTTDPSAIAGSDTYRTVIGLPMARFRWVGLAAGLVLALGLVWWLTRGGEPPPEPTVEVTPEPEPAPVAAVAQPRLGGVTVDAMPWAEITEVTDGEGYLQELPEPASTPLYLELPPGLYKIQLKRPDDETLQTCDVEVTLDTLATCVPAFDEPSVTDYFKESGWWR